MVLSAEDGIMVLLRLCVVGNVTETFVYGGVSVEYGGGVMIGVVELVVVGMYVVIFHALEGVYVPLRAPIGVEAEDEVLVVVVVQLVSTENEDIFDDMTVMTGVVLEFVYGADV